MRRKTPLERRRHFDQGKKLTCAVGTDETKAESRSEEQDWAKKMGKRRRTRRVIHCFVVNGPRGDKALMTDDVCRFEILASSLCEVLVPGAHGGYQRLVRHTSA